MPSNVPDKPTSPFDGTDLTDEEVRGLDQQQLVWVDLTDTQWITLTDYQMANPPPAGPPHEYNTDHIPAPEQVQKVREFFQWIDTMHKGVRKPGGMAWIEMQLLLVSLTKWMDWAQSEPNIDGRYRYRIDTPMDPDAQAPDHLPEDW